MQPPSIGIVSTSTATISTVSYAMRRFQELHAHNNSMMRTGHPGDAKAIAISSRPPGSLSQAELRGEEHASPRPPKSISRKKDDKTNAAQLLFSQLMNSQTQSPSQVTVSADWLSAFLLNNPTLLPLLHHGHTGNEDAEVQLLCLYHRL
ncbi:hypothetical protein ANCCAN_17307 [Ancylostoma caninum]|uniref:Uncharacterized protein n=1 Tax=Ancylostoma caninum TaxID=29170 RepID=A0A368G0N1_ANCCA|nr:hypothetical protein ANCCAN_17307 [Ancylostoma caninum]